MAFTVNPNTTLFHRQDNLSQTAGHYNKPAVENLTKLQKGFPKYSEKE